MHKLFATAAVATAALGLTATAVAAGPRPAENIVDLAVGSDDFDVLVAAADATGLVPALAGDDQLTVFAPTDAAFEERFGLDEAAIIADVALYDSEELDGLRSILLYHVTEGRRGAKSVVPVPQLATLNGTPITKERGVAILDTAADADGAQVIATLPASNGIVHVIDAVLVPVS